MGLDLTAYSRLQHVECESSAEHGFCRKYDEHDDPAHINAFAYAGFERSYALAARDRIFNIGGFSFCGGACYVETDQTEKFGFPGGSYGGYNHFRELLAAVAGIEDLREWRASPDYSQPFALLLNFADNEGTIGAEAAKILWRQFCEHRGQFAAQFGDFLIKYDNFTEGFRIAKDGGLVGFH